MCEGGLSFVFYLGLVISKKTVRLNISMQGNNNVIYPGIRYSCSCIEGNKKPVGNVNGHIKKFTLIPLHALMVFFKQFGYNMTTKKTTET